MLPFILTISESEGRDYLEELFYEHSSRMYRAAMKILENRDDAEDAVQDTFVKIHNNISKFKSLSGDELILLIIVYTRNTARDILRRRNTVLRHSAESVYDDDKEEILCEIPDPYTDTLSIVIDRENVRRTAEMIDCLPQAQKDAIILKYRYGMREKEIATALCISETAVSSRILRAKEKLRSLMKNF